MSLFVHSENPEFRPPDERFGPAEEGEEDTSTKAVETHIGPRHNARLGHEVAGKRSEIAAEAPNKEIQWDKTTRNGPGLEKTAPNMPATRVSSALRCRPKNSPCIRWSARRAGASGCQPCRLPSCSGRCLPGVPTIPKSRRWGTSRGRHSIVTPR